MTTKIKAIAGIAGIVLVFGVGWYVGAGLATGKCEANLRAQYEAEILKRDEIIAEHGRQSEQDETARRLAAQAAINLARDNHKLSQKLKSMQLSHPDCDRLLTGDAIRLLNDSAKNAERAATG